VKPQTKEKRMKIAAATPVAAACLLALAGCSGTKEFLKERPATVATSGTYYCWQEKLADEGSGLTCNWQQNMRDACDSTSFMSLSKGSLTGTPQKTHRCENGQWLVAVTTR
jgi:hypothetical protein